MKRLQNLYNIFLEWLSANQISTKWWYTPPKHPSGHQLSMLTLNKAIHSAQHSNTPEAPYLQSGITFAKKDAIYSASLLACCSLPPLRLKLKQTTSSAVTGYMFETQV
jgi:hypothetical protein